MFCILGKNEVYIASVVALYWVVSISMVYLNKVVLSNKETSISAPLFVTWFQSFVTCMICDILGRIGEKYRRKSVKSCFDEFPIVAYNMDSGLKVMPLSIAFVGMIAFNNFCLKYVEVSFYNVARSLSIVFNVIFTYFLLGKSTQYQTCGTLVIVIIGFLIGIDGETNFSLFGTVCGVISSVFVSLNSIYTSKVLPKVHNDKSLLLYYNNFNAVLLFSPLILIFEHKILLEQWTKVFSVMFWAMMLLSGIMGYAIGFVTVLQSLLAFYIWGNAATTKGVLGIFLVLFGSGLYTAVQMNSNPSAPSVSAATLLPVANKDIDPEESESLIEKTGKASSK